MQKRASGIAPDARSVWAQRCSTWQRDSTCLKARFSAFGLCICMFSCLASSRSGSSPQLVQHPQSVQHGAHMPGRTIEGDPEACSPSSVFFFSYICSLLSITGLWPSVGTGRWMVLAAATEAAAPLLSACGAAGFLVCARRRSGRGPAHSDHSARESSPGECPPGECPPEECPPGECPCCTRLARKGLSNSDLTSNQHANGLPSACRSVS